jgi:anti-sigma factor RsiW
VDHPETELVPYLRGELDPSERAEVARHLDECAQCRESADTFTSVMKQVAARLDELPAPHWGRYRAELRQKIAARVEAVPWWRRAIFIAPLGTAVAGAIALLIFFAIGPAHRGATPGEVPIEQLAMEQFPGEQPVLDNPDVGLLKNYEVVQNLDLLENYDVIEHLDELSPADHQPDETRS